MYPLIDELMREGVLRPEDAAARYRLAEALVADGDFATAAKQLERAIKLDGADHNAHRLLAKTYERAGRGPDALRTLEALARRAPGDANAAEDLADCLATLGERERAVELYRRAGCDAKLRSLEAAARNRDAAPAVGKIGVLGWTPSGGAVSPLEAVAVVGHGQLIISSNVGQVGREAGKVAISCLKYKARE